MSRLEIYALLMISLVCIGVRLYGIDNPLYDKNYWRQTETAAIAMNYYEDNAPFLYPEIDWCGLGGHAEMEFPLFPYLVSVAYHVVGPYDILGRLLAILCSLGTTLAVFVLGKNLYSSRTGLFAAALFSAAPLTIYYGRSFQPDMMMVFLSTASLATLSHWQLYEGRRWIILSALSLSLAVLLKPPSLLVALPLVGMLLSRIGWRRLPWIGINLYASLVLIPMVLWYTHARSFFVETGATFMWHFKEFQWDTHVRDVFLSSTFYLTLLERFTSMVFVYAGWIPFLLGGVLLLTFPRKHVIAILWGLGIIALYLIIAAHHIGHDYYSLLAVPCVALVGAIGLEMLSALIPFKRVTFLMGVGIILLTGVGLWNLIQSDAYGKRYYFYEDSIAMREIIPEDSLIAVMDELPHTPEFFYFANRNGWRRMRDASHGIDDSAWLEEMRNNGADYYVGLNESPGNHPIRYLTDHIMGNYINSHYAITWMGYRCFVANLAQPFYGDHLFTRLGGKRIAVSDPSLYQNHIKSQFISLADWQKSDVILFDFHTLDPAMKQTWASIYSLAIEDGFVLTRQDSGRLVLERSSRVDPVPNLVSLCRSTLTNPDSITEEWIHLGWLEAGTYRISFNLDPNILENNNDIELLASDYLGNLLAYRSLNSFNQQHVNEGERPEILLHLNESKRMQAALRVDKTDQQPRSVVCMPDVLCIQQDAIIQAEQLLNKKATITSDPIAVRQSALFAKRGDMADYMTVGPFFQFPGGDYRFTYVARNPASHDSSVDLILYADGKTPLGKQTVTIEPNREAYSTWSFDTPLTSTQAVETRTILHANSEILFDTVHIQQRTRQGIPLPSLAGFLLAADQPLRVSTNGFVLRQDGNAINRAWLQSATIASAVWSQSSGILLLEPAGVILDTTGKKIAHLPTRSEEQWLDFALASDGATCAAISTQRRLVVGSLQLVEEMRAYTLPTYDYHPRDVKINERGEVYVLYGNGAIWSPPKGWINTGLPAFGFDALRALIFHKKGFYVVDCAGALHSSKETPPVKSPIYIEDDWIRDAIRTTDGDWFYLDNQGQMLMFPG